MSEERLSYKYCIVPRCRNTTISTPNKLFINVPKDAKLRKRWCDVMKRDSKKNVTLSSKSSRFCCEDHFKLEDDMENFTRWKMMGGYIKLKEGIVPHIFNCQHTTIAPRERSAAKKRYRADILKTIFASKEPQPSTSTSAPMETETYSSDLSDSETITENNLLTSVNHKNIQVRKKDFCRSKQTQTENYVSTTNTASSPIEFPVSDADSSLSKISKKRDSREKSSSRSSSELEESASDWETENESDVDSAQEFKAIMLKGTIMSIEKDPKLYLGITKETYFCLEILSEKTSASYTDILVTLKKIRLNEPYTILAMQFGKSHVNIGQIFRRTVPELSKYFKELVVWPASDKIEENLPIAFRVRYSKVKSIIDCFEIQIKKPSNPLQQSLSWSEYKSCNTVKYMISCTPDGLVNFISSGFGGRASDTVIFENCGFVNNLSPGMDIMADRGFKNIDNILSQHSCRLVRPPSVSSSTLSSKEDVLESKRIASLRIHVERVIGRLREFNMLLPHARIDIRYLSIFDEVVIIACGLINLQNTLIKY